MNHHPLLVLRVPPQHEEDETNPSQLWIPDGEVAFRLVHFSQLAGDDVVVSFVNERGLVEKRRLPRSESHAHSGGLLSEDLSLLPEPNAATALAALDTRYGHSLIHTNCGLYCIVVNPWKILPLYSRELRSLYRREHGSLPPHVYSVAQAALQGMNSGNTSQAILITGESGSGKTENTKRIIEFIMDSGEDGGGGDGRILAFTQLLEAFGNAKTRHNDNSSRFGKLIRLSFSPRGTLLSSSVQGYLLEKSRVVAQEKGERSFHVFYQLLSSPPMLRESLHLVFDSYTYLNEQATSSSSVAETEMYLSRLGLSPSSIHDVYKVASACLLLGQIPFDERRGLDVSFVRGRRELNWTAELLGVRAETLEDSLTNPQITVGGATLRKSQNLSKTLHAAAALAKTLYERLFLWILQRCNEATTGPSVGGPSIGVLDMAGFEMMNVNSFEQLCINFTNERLQQLFNECLFQKERKEYEEEGVEWTAANSALDLQPTISLFQQPLGLFSLLEEECVVPNGAESQFLEKLLHKHGGHSAISAAKHSQRSTQVHHFSISHYAGRVDYNVDRWVEKNRDRVEAGMRELLASSTHPIVKSFFPVTESTAVEQGRRPSSYTVSFVYRQQLDYLLSLLTSSQCHFVRCILPNRERNPHRLDRPLVLHQLKCNGVLESIRVCRKGFPTRMPFNQFIRRYKILCSHSTRLNWEGKEAVLCLCEEVLGDNDDFRVGHSRVFLRVGLRTKMETMRAAKLDYLLTGIQARIRSIIALREAAAMEKNRDASLLIQHNVRLFGELRQWPWFRLFSSIRPLIDTDRLQKQLERAEAEVEILRALLEEKEEQAREDEEVLRGLEEQLMEAERKRDEAEESAAKERKERRMEMEQGEETLSLMERRFTEQRIKVAGMVEKMREYERAVQNASLELEETRNDRDRIHCSFVRTRDELEAALHSVSTMESELKKQQRSVDGLNEERNSLQIQLSKAEVEAETQGEEARRMRDTLSQIQTNLAECQERSQRAEGVAGEERRKRRALEARLADAKDIVAHKDSLIASCKEKAAKMKETTRENERTIHTLQKKLSDKEEVMKECLDHLKESHKQKVTELKDIVEELKRKNSRLENERATRGDSVLERESSVDSDYGASSSLRRSSSRLLSRQTSLSSLSSFSSFRTLSRRMTEPAPDVTIPLSRSPSMAMEMERRAADAERAAHTMATDLALARREIEVYKETIAVLEADKATASRAAKAATSRAVEAERSMENAVDEKKAMETRLNGALATMEERRTAWEEQCTQHAMQIETHRKAAASRVDGLQEERRILTNKLRAAENKEEEAEKERGRLECQVERHRQQAEEAERRVMGHAAVGDNWQGRCYAAESELQSLRDDNGILKGKLLRLHRQIQLLTQQDDTSEMVAQLEHKMGGMNGV